MYNKFLCLHRVRVSDESKIKYRGKYQMMEKYQIFVNDQEVVNEDRNDAYCNGWRENCRINSRIKQMQISIHKTYTYRWTIKVYKPTR